MALFAMGPINMGYNWPNERWRSEETYKGCCCTILVISTCIVLSEIFGD
jgi:hypothetical protein